MLNSRVPRVLFVEDEECIRSPVAEYLRDAGFHVVEAESGDEAIPLLIHFDGFDVLFTDVKMPGIFDGLHLAARARVLHPGMPVLIVSGFALDLSKRLRELGPPHFFISKPYQLASVVEKLTEMIKGSRYPHATRAPH